MNTVNSWIDPDEIAELMERLGTPQEGENGEGSEAAEGEGGAWKDSVKDGQLPEGRRSGMAESAARQRVRKKLAEIKEQAAASGLLQQTAPERRGIGGLPFTSADVDVSLAARDRVVSSLGDRLTQFADDVARRHGCVRVMVTDSRGYSLLPDRETEAGLVAAALSLSQDWVSCQKHLRLKDPGPLSAMLGKGYKMLVMPCETAFDLVTLAMVSRRGVGDEDAEAARAELLGILAG